MKRGIISLYGFFAAIILLKAQTPNDSLVRFADLKFQSDFEKEALMNYTGPGKVAFDLFLGIDENMTANEAERFYNTFLSVFKTLDQKKIGTKNINKKIRLAYSTVHGQFLKKYNGNEYFPAVFLNGTYNCVTASMLYALVFDRLNIPYKLMASSEHVYLIANPGPNSVVVETTNPGFEKAIFTGEFKQHYVYYLRNSKMISEEEYKNKSVEEIFEEKFNEVKEAKFENLPGFQYYNKAFDMLKNNNGGEGYELCQKAYYFFPDQQVKTLLYTALIMLMNNCDYKHVEDIDYLVQLSKFENTDQTAIVSLFNNVLLQLLQYTDKEAYCDSLYNRLISRVSDDHLRDELSFYYYLQMSYRYQNTDKVEYYVSNALKIKGNYQDANTILENFLNRKLFSISNPLVRLDSIEEYEQKYRYEQIIPVLNTQRLFADLEASLNFYRQNQPKTGEAYLQQFEDHCTMPVENFLLRNRIENTYHSIALFYFSKNNKPKLRSTLDRGLGYVPDSRLLKSARETVR